MHFHPQRWAKVYDHWLTNIQDWCISRQLWWGHRIPVWRQSNASISLGEARGIQLEPFLNKLAEENPNGLVYSRHPTGDTVSTPGTTLHEFVRYVAVAPNHQDVIRTLEDLGFTQDPDVLDTWFSSWLWPFATMGWTGDETHDSKNATLQTFYPTTDLVTAPDIIFFWVARMIMAGYEYPGDLPFRNVYFTGLIRDKQGRKMSKTLGNSPDPLELITRYGADALRFGTMRSAPLGQDILFDEKDVELGRNFCNKLWNACRFRQMVGQASSLSGSAGFQPAPLIEGEIDPALLTSDDKWILLKLDAAIREIDAAFAEYRFSEVTATLYRFFWSEYCDWYVEASKAALAKPTPNPSQEGNSASASESQLPSSGGLGGGSIKDRNKDLNVERNKLAVIDFILSHTLRLFHPFLPFITEELWHGLGYNIDLPASQGGDTIMFAHWPKPLDDDFKAHYGLRETVAEFVDAKYELVTRGRNLRREANVAANKKVKFILKVVDPLPANEAEVIRLLLNAETLEIDPNYAPKKGTPSTPSDLGELFLPLEGLLDVSAEKARLTKELSKADSEIEKVRTKLNNPDFVQRVPANVLDEHKKRLADWESRREQIRAALDNLPQ
jgi:valyl-tRNA synthetase